MRITHLTAAPILAALTAIPAGAQVSARLHLDIPLGRRAPIVADAPRRQVLVREYDPSLFGAWDGYYDDWAPVTLYLYDGYYYDYPIVEYARPVVVYSYRNQFFLPPRDRGFEIWRQQYRGTSFRGGFRGYSRDDHGFRPAPRFDRDDRRVGPLPRDGRDVRRFEPVPRGDQRGRDQRVAPRNQGGGNDAHQGGNRGGNRGGDRSRPRP